MGKGSPSRTPPPGARLSVHTHYSTQSRGRESTSPGPSISLSRRMPRGQSYSPTMLSRRPRGLARLTALVVLMFVGATVWFGGMSSVENGRWDTSTAAERARAGGSGSGAGRPFWESFTAWLSPRYRLHWSDNARDASPVIVEGPSNRISGVAPRPNLSRLGKVANRTYDHPGVSRVLLRGGEYATSRLPSLDEAFAHLYPRLNEVKDNVPAVPREHILNAPLFPPFLTDDLRKRYAHLQQEVDEVTGEWLEGTEKRYLFVTVCRQVAGMLADWYATWTVLADFLGPESCIFSLNEGSSEDGSGELLDAMRDHLLFIGVPPENIFVKTHLPDVNWDNSHRIELLADMRNAAMEPIFASKTPHLSPDGKPWTAIVFYNDVYLSATHMLELMHQQFYQDADMTCGWDHAGKWFYDGWVGRDMSGDLYTPFPVPEEEQDLPQKLFINSPETLARHERNLPYQVFAGWNGMVVMSPTPFLPPYNVRFRRGVPRAPHQRPGEEECQASESSFISWDFWKYGFGRIQTVPGVHLTYGKDDARVRGWVDFPHPDAQHPERIQWKDDPPAKVRCHDWPDKLGKGYWAWDNVRWVDPPKLEVPPGAALTNRATATAGENARK